MDEKTNPTASSRRLDGKTFGRRRATRRSIAWTWIAAVQCQGPGGLIASRSAEPSALSGLVTLPRIELPADGLEVGRTDRRSGSRESGHVVSRGVGVARGRGGAGGRYSLRKWSRSWLSSRGPDRRRSHDVVFSALQKGPTSATQKGPTEISTITSARGRPGAPSPRGDAKRTGPPRRSRPFWCHA